MLLRVVGSCCFVVGGCLFKQTVVIAGDLNMDRLRLGSAYGKIPEDLEEVNSFQCLITELTRITEQSQTLLDVLRTNTPEHFEK